MERFKDEGGKGIEEAKDEDQPPFLEIEQT